MMQNYNSINMKIFPPTYCGPAQYKLGLHAQVYVYLGNSDKLHGKNEKYDNEPTWKD